MKNLCVHPSGRYLSAADGTPFFLLGDTAWNLLHNLTREEAVQYLTVRKAQGFNFVQTVVLAENDGLRVPNAYGRVPLCQDENGRFLPDRPDTAGDYSYFDHVEWFVTTAEEMDMYVGLLPTWGDKFNLWWGDGPEIFTPDNAFFYGKFLGTLLAHHNNIVWVMGGDRPPEKPVHYAIIDRMAAGIKAGDRGKFLMTYHPPGQHTSGEYWHEREWLDFNMMQTGHDKPAPACYLLAAQEYARTPHKPVMDGEPCYEDIPVNVKPGHGYWYDDAPRRTAWRDLFSGTCSHTYGHHAVWQMNRTPSPYCPFTWQEALHRPCAEQLHVLREFVETHRLFGGVPLTDAVTDNAEGDGYVTALSHDGGTFLYIPRAATVTLTLPVTPTAVEAIDPKTGAPLNVTLCGKTLIVPAEAVVTLRG